MCDTILGSPATTATQIMLFGKNSDRQRNEAQSVELVPAAEHAPGSHVHCTYVSIPQVRRTHAVMLCRPFWIWGAEMGANEHGVVIGNEGVQARSAPPEKRALIGMDLIRLALERASTAADAIRVMTELLERHGQGGNCGHLTPSYYNNAFMVADAKDAYVLETLGREWLLETVQGVRAMSNRYSIDRAQRTSTGLNQLVMDAGWQVHPHSHAETIASPDREHIGNAGARRTCSTSLMGMNEGRLTSVDMIRILRDHGSGAQAHPHWREECAHTRTLCMHAGTHDRSGQTVGSMVSELRPRDAVHWVTATAAPCISIFKPVLMDVPVPAHGAEPTDRFDPDAYWWRHEQFHRTALMGDFANVLAAIAPEREELEATFVTRIAEVLDGGNLDDRSVAVRECWREARAMEESWASRVRSSPPADALGYTAAWLDMNRIAGMDRGA